jgi:hypothetical protein
MYPERIKLDIEDEIIGFEKTTLVRLFNSFDSIESESAEERMFSLERKAMNFT